MDKKFTEKLTDEIWGRWWSIPVFLIMSILAAIPIIVNILSSVSYTVTENGISYNVPKMSGVYISIAIGVCFLGLNLWNVLFVYSKSHIKRASRGKTGILIYIDTDDKQIYKETIRKFGEEFKENLFNEFEVIYVPFGMKKIDYRTEKIVPFLRKRHCILFIDIGINYDKDNTSVIYDMKINGSIIHKTYTDDVQKEFKKILTASLHNFKNIIFPSKEMIKRLRITATEMSLACEYVIGLSLFLNGDLKKAEVILSEVVKRSSGSEQWDKVYLGIQRIRHEIFMIYAMIYMEKYQRQCDDESLLDQVDDMLEKAKECCGMTYEYCLNKAYYYIAKKHDSKKAGELINLCKQMKHVPQIWKYSEAFLKAYDNKSIGSIITSYNTALRVEYNIPDLIVFIESVLEREPNRSGLLLAVGILYKNLGDEELSDESIKKYIESTKDPQKTVDILTKKKLYSR